MFKIGDKKWTIHPDRIKKGIVSIVEIEIVGIEEREHDGQKHNVYLYKLGKKQSFFDQEFAETRLKDTREEMIEASKADVENAIEKYTQGINITIENIGKMRKAKKELEKHIAENRKFLVQLKDM